MIFILDNFDSFTYNLFQYFGEIGEQVIVKRRDECDLEGIVSLNPELIVISPGPGTPNDAPLALEVIEKFKGRIPILGVCLGHQAIGQVFGGEIIRAIKPVHGKSEKINHDGKGVFIGLPHPLEVTRYHSLVVDRSSLLRDLIVSAETKDGEIMGLRHRTLPIEGVQFHPEAILTLYGHELLSNAVNNAREWNNSQLSSIWQIKKLDLALKPYILLEAFRNYPGPFFLDSGENYQELGRYSFLGAYPFLEATGYLDKVEIRRPEQKRYETISCEKSSLKVLDEIITCYQVPEAAPFPFAGGAVGYFSYDLKDELEVLPNIAKNDILLPLWRLAWYDGVLVYDHLQEKYSLVACGIDENGVCKPELANVRMNRMQDIVHSYCLTNSQKDLAKVQISKKNSLRGLISPSVDREQYLQDLKRVIEYIYAGDIYQADLTQRFTTPWSGDSWQLYQELHEKNPAPFAAFLHYPDFQILSCSPERFILIDANKTIETRPIKGTRPRGKTSAEDEALAKELQKSGKDRAELTMIIDLERNDLGRICRFGTVRVPDLIRLEKYPTVWHLVSTITGELLPGLKPSEILKAIFPGGSITGTPKIRAMEILEGLEPFKRGVYTGSIGYLGFDGAWDLNIVIRTIIIRDGTAYINAGGGIVADSDPEAEYQETIDKARALFKVLGGKFMYE